MKHLYIIILIHFQQMKSVWLRRMNYQKAQLTQLSTSLCIFHDKTSIFLWFYLFCSESISFTIRQNKNKQDLSLKCSVFNMYTQFLILPSIGDRVDWWVGGRCRRSFPQPQRNLHSKFQIPAKSRKSSWWRVVVVVGGACIPFQCSA